jgi:predicted GIY-YIG superfamily endonuclease
MAAVVYLIHFDQPYKHARHYLGYTTDLGARLDAHKRGEGARLMEVITEAGIGWRVARLWIGDCDRRLERRLKRRKNAPRLCPICQGAGSDGDDLPFDWCAGRCPQVAAERGA